MEERRRKEKLGQFPIWKRGGKEKPKKQILGLVLSIAKKKKNIFQHVAKNKEINK